MLIFACAHYFVACLSYNNTTLTTAKIKGSVSLTNNAYISDVVLLNGIPVYFEKKGQFIDTVGKIFSGIVAQDAFSSRRVSIPLDSILYCHYKSVNAGSTVLTFLSAVLVVGLAVFIVALAAKQCCPFIYSYDGNQYVFDAEPLGGAVCEGLERTDLSPLHQLREVDGEYRLMVRNEVPETQHLDEMKLVVVDHDPSTEVVPDPFGRLHLLHPPVAPSRATLDRTSNILPFLMKRDQINWQTNMNQYGSTESDRHEIRLTFPMPKDTSHSRLVVNMGTAIWGSKMIKEMLLLRGDSVVRWYNSVNHHGDELLKMGNFVLREELYLLKVKVLVAGKWVDRQIIPATGPFITEDRTVTLDLSGITGDSVEIKLEPPRGFWQIDYIGLTSGSDSIISDPTVLSMATAESSTGADTKNILAQSDSIRYDMPDVGDWFKMSFKSPPLKAGTVRSLFMKTRGYYDIHLPSGNPENTNKISEILKNKGEILKYSKSQFNAMKNTNQTEVLHLNH